MNKKVDLLADVPLEQLFKELPGLQRLVDALMIGKERELEEMNVHRVALSKALSALISSMIFDEARGRWIIPDAVLASREGFPFLKPFLYATSSE